MGLLDTVGGYLKAQLNQQIQQLGYVQRSELTTPRMLYGSETYPGQQYDVYANYTNTELYRLAMTNYPVYRNVKLLGNRVAGGRIMVQEPDTESDEGWKEVEGHDFTKIIDYQPNKFMSQSVIWMYQVSWLLLSGEAYWLMFQNKMGLAEVYPLPANRVKPIPDPETGIKWFAYTPINGSYPKLIRPEQICFHKLPNPFEYWRGMSPISAYLWGLKLNSELQKFDYEDYHNQLNLNTLISVRAGMLDREFNVALADLKRMHEERLRFKMIRAGEMKVDTVSQERNQYSDQMYRVTESEANYIFGVPDAYWRQDKAYKAGDYENQLTNDTVWPLMNLLAEDLTVQMYQPNYADGGRVMFEDIRYRDIELDLKQQESDRQVQTYDEARAKQNLPAHPDPTIGNAPAYKAGEIALELVKMGQPIDGSANMQEEINRAVQAATGMTTAAQQSSLLDNPDEALQTEDVASDVTPGEANTNGRY